jgi:PilZ domain
MSNFSTLDGPERRRRIRFPIALSARCSVAGQQETGGTCRTVNISSHGALITSTPKVLPGTRIGVVIDWPIPIGNLCPLALHILGKVVRSEDGLVAVQFSTYELRTQPKVPNHVQSLPKRRVRSR